MKWLTSAAMRITGSGYTATPLYLHGQEMNDATTAKLQDGGSGGRRLRGDTSLTCTTNTTQNNLASFPDGSGCVVGTNRLGKGLIY
ncbi:hypothetical protein PIB30_027276 [Stylosanthes scabra]|uniref:Uncharacterized protein n=1 Tax=Stylosanthes scabra TaxID=79078 RepID=A0ABU6XCA6_9FABA|nr:hypothetical protein [Stylosanthes scabra]